MVRATFELCDTEEKLGLVINSLQNSSLIFLDCEGKTLGSIGGQISLLSLGVVENGDDGIKKLHIYLVDVLAFTGEKLSLLHPIFNSLESRKVIKVVFDGRMDASELFHGHNVALQCVIDLQVADIASRDKRGETVQRRIQRLDRYVPWYDLSTNTAGYQSVYRLNGLDSALREHGILTQTGKKDFDHTMWLRRPLTGLQQQYAAKDIVHIYTLFHHFHSKGYIKLPTLIEQSERYIRLHTKGRPDKDDMYVRNALLPLCILEKIPDGSTLTECQGCKRNLPRDCFKEGNASRCWVCRAVTLRNGGYV
ncbi:hypothetical protein CPB86DRAFT_878673 [Serendipita vermifera]|nr:hypothetical protein CPB86DRAFT_878673 [Serendipita vermifera]